MANSRKQMNSLKYLMNEVISEKRLSQKINSNTIKFTTLDESAINSLLQSNLFTKNESIAMHILFSKTKTRTLSESIIKKLEKSVNTIIESKEGDAILSEGFFSDIWDGIKGLGDKAKEVLAGGWGKIKAVWSEFSALVTEVASACKDGLLKAFGSFAGKAKDAASKASSEAEKKISAISDQKTFATEVKNLYDSSKYITTTFFSKWISAPTWEKDMVAGSVAPAEDVKIDAAKAEDGLDDLKTMESVKKMKLNLIKERNGLFSNSNVVSELYRSSNNRAFIFEGGGFAHLEGAIKNPALKGIVELSVKILQSVFAPLAKIAQIVTGMVGKALLKKFSEATKLLGGPGVFEFVILSGILSEIMEVAVKLLTPGGADIVGFFIPPLVPIFATAKTFITIVGGCLIAYSVATVIVNMIPTLQKKAAGGGTHESYSPRGEFKIQDGNLFYVK